MIELKRGMNFIIGRNAYTAQELVALLRKTVLTLVVLSAVLSLVIG